MSQKRQTPTSKKKPDTDNGSSKKYTPNDYHNYERLEGSEFFIAIEEDPSLPPLDPADETSTNDPGIRRSAFSVEDLDELLESDFPDVGKDVSKTPAEVKRIVNEIKSVTLFSSFDEDELSTVAGYMYTQPVRAGEVVIERGAAGDAFYVVKNGKFRCTVLQEDGKRQSTLVREYDNKGYFGELALVNKKPRAATITAVTEGSLWVLSALRYSWLHKRHAMMNAERFDQLIKSIPLFRSYLDPSQANRLIDALELLNLSPGEVVCRQGEPGDAMYFVMEGKIQAVIDRNAVKTIGPNQYFGERALIREEGRAATCRALVKTRLAKLPKESFQLLIPDAVIEKMKKTIVDYESDDHSDDVTDDTLSTTASVYMEYFCQELKK